jgi:hypothetical protein
MMARRGAKSAPPGSVVLIDLGQGFGAVGRTLKPPLFEFFDLFLAIDNDIDLTEVARARVLFRIDVMNAAVQSGRWKVVGALPLSEQERNRREVFFKQSPMTGALSLYSEDPVSGTVCERPATLDECTSLERAAVWSAEHVEDRLRDHFAGRPNKWVQSMRPHARR